VSVVLPASGWLMMANVRRRWASDTGSVTDQVNRCRLSRANSRVSSGPNSGRPGDDVVAALWLREGQGPAGRRTMNEAPASSRLVAWIVPPWAATSSLATASPTPLPPVPAVRRPR
jgi:hypothetical protein